MTTEQLSNELIEGVNRKIKQIKRTVYGYKNWQNFIYRIQIEIKIKKRTQFINELNPWNSSHQHWLTETLFKTTQILFL